MDLSWINIPFGYLMKFCLLISGNYYIIALLFFAIIMQIVLLPLGIKQHKSQIIQRKLRPKEMAIRKKYAGRTDRATQQKMTLEIQEMYKSENYNQFAGCLPMLIQLPIIIILFAIVRNPISYSSTIEMKNNLETLYTQNGEIIEQYKDREKITGDDANYNSYVEALQKAKDSLDKKDELLLTKIIVEDYDYFAEIAEDHSLKLEPSEKYEKHSKQEDREALPKFNFLNETLLDTPAYPWINLNILLIIPILIFVSSYYGGVISRKFMAAPIGAENNPMMSGWFMKWGMPAMSTWFAFSFPAAVGIYWIWRTVTGAAQPLILNKMYPMPVITKEDIAEAEKEIKKKKKKKVIMIEVDEDDDTYNELEVRDKPVSSSKKMLANNKVEMLSADDEEEEDDDESSDKN
ncbi:MAG: hypothetical protein A2Y15_00855 [Clostridiales bacterium GWF2_36_10]|nr:MAG: hypothetical protein A2Y15_00855 [Clostridiales bacterium GWF2_36_10]